MSNSASQTNAHREPRNVTTFAILRAVALTVLLVASAIYEAARVTAILNGNVWMHLRTGLWMLQGHSIPHSGLFSQYSSLPWMDASWGYDLLLGAAYKLLGLRAIPLLMMFFRAALALVTFVLARSGKANFWTAACLCAVAQYVIPVSQSLPYGVSILLFGVELALLERSRRTGSFRTLFWLPPLFVLWANLHVLFVSGLVLLVFYLFSIWLEGVLRRAGADWLSPEVRPLSVRPVAAILSCSFLATLMNPYTFHLYPLAHKALYSDMTFKYFAEMWAMSFRRPQDYLLMLLVMAAFLAVGRRRSVKVFELLMLVGVMLVSFRIQRESWMAVLASVAVLGDSFGFRKKEFQSTGETSQRWESWTVAGLAAAILTIAAFRLPPPDALMSRVSRNLPVKAVDFIRDNHLPRPMFNEYSWGSFLMWYLPEYPVAIDSRVELYGDEITERYFKVIAGGVRLDANPSLAAAQTLLLQRQSGVVKALTTIPALTSQYRLAYSDDVAAVFVRQ